MIRQSKHLIAELEKENLRFRSFSLIHEGDYSAEDADWNYKDVPHLHHIHQQVEAVPARAEKDFIVSINMQKILFCNFPMTVVNLESGPNSQMYFTSFIFISLIIETTWEEIRKNKTRVTTTYNVGMPWVLLWLYPLIKWTIHRNYNNLMSGDIPMRLRRGQLRNWGYSFKHNSSRYEFTETMAIAKDNVVVPTHLDTDEMNAAPIHLSKDLNHDSNQVFWGRSDHHGLRIVRSKSELLFFPRMCPHEGALLDDSKCDLSTVHCPWHGRAFKPIARMPIGDQDEVIVATAYHRISLKSGVLAITNKCDLANSLIP